MSKLYRIFILLLILISGQCVFIRKQIIQQDAVLGEVILIEEIRDSNSAETLDELMENNAMLIKQELDYAAEFANLLLNTIEGELMEDNIITNDDSLFNTFEGLKGVVTAIQQAEDQYLDELNHKKEEKDIKIIQEFVSEGESKEFDWSSIISEDSYYRNEIPIDSEQTTNTPKQEELNQSKKQEKKEVTNFSQTDQNLEEKEGQNCSDDTITDADIEEVAQYDSWIIDDDENESIQNFNVNTQLDKGTIKMKLPNMGVGPQISMKTSNTQLPLYEDPSVIVGGVSFLIILITIFYYFFQSNKNLRKSSSSSILEQSNVQLLLNKSQLKRGEEELIHSEKFKIF